MIRNLLALLFGCAVGVSGTFLHNAYRPAGLAISLIAVTVGAYLVGEMYRSRFASMLYAVGWAGVVVRGSSIGNGGELLIEANGYGNIFVLGGALLLLLTLLRSRRLS